MLSSVGTVSVEATSELLRPLGLRHRKANRDPIHAVRATYMVGRLFTPERIHGWRR
jgi:hypothetical protein